MAETNKEVVVPKPKELGKFKSFVVRVIAGVAKAADKDGNGVVEATFKYDTKTKKATFEVK